MKARTSSRSILRVLTGHRAHSTRGFTIVELLIVIVVIAILTGVTVVAYSGIRERADAVKAASIVNAYTKILHLYYADYQRFPSTGGGAYGYDDACLGSVADFPAVSGTFNAGDCLYNTTPGSAGGGDGHYRVGAYTPFSTLIAPYVSSLPSGRLANSQLGNEMWRGVRYSAFYNDKMVRIDWIIPGAHEDWCGKVTSASDAWWGSTWCTLDIDMR